MALLWLFLRVKWNRTSTISERIRRIDVIGNSILIASTVSVLLALTWADTVYSWSSYQITVPLVLGMMGLVLFIWFESSGIAPEPVMPLRLFANRTSAVVYATTFLNSMLLYWLTFFLPIFFMSVLLSSPSWAGVQMLPLVLVGIPGAALSAVVLSRWGRYKALHVAGFAIGTLGLGLFAIMNSNTTTAVWAVIEVVAAFGFGMLLNTILPAFQAGLAEKDQAAATASWSFIRSFGSIWGVAIPATIFNAYTSLYADDVEDIAVRNLLRSGDAYASASKAFVESFEEPLRGQIIGVYSKALKNVFLISLAFGGLGVLLSLAENEIKLRTDLETEFGLEGEEKKKEKGRANAEEAGQSS
jgi:hypothetical protein